MWNLESTRRLQATAYLPPCLPCLHAQTCEYIHSSTCMHTHTHTYTHIHTCTHEQHRCQAGWNYQRCASTCPTTFPRNHGNLVRYSESVCVVCLLCFKGLQCPSASHSLSDCSGPRWSHSTSFKNWIGSSLHGNNLFFLCGCLRSLKETRRA